MKWGYILFLLMLVMGLCVVDASAQCAMCRATLENNVSNGDINMATRLNFGIMYLFVLPYVLVVLLAVLWYKKSKRNRNLKIKAERRRKRISEVL